MSVIVIVYGSFIYLVFFRFKLLPWNKVTRLPALAVGLLLCIGFLMGIENLTPKSSQAVITGRIADIAPQVGGEVVEVPIEQNVEVEAGTVLFRLDPTLFEARVPDLEAALKLARLRLGQFQELARADAAPRFQLEQVEIEIDGTATFAAAYGANREDTAQRCDDTNTGFGLRLNWNELGDGEHTLRALADGKELGRATFTVTTLGETFLTGASGVYDLPDFPEPDATVTVEWREASQNFVIIEAEGVERPSPDPVE